MAHVRHHFFVKILAVPFSDDVCRGILKKIRIELAGLQNCIFCNVYLTILLLF